MIVLPHVRDGVRRVAVECHGVPLLLVIEVAGPAALLPSVASAVSPIDQPARWSWAIDSSTGGTSVGRSSGKVETSPPTSLHPDTTRTPRPAEGCPTNRGARVDCKSGCLKRQRPVCDDA